MDSFDRVKRYVDMRKEKPLKKCSDAIHGVHLGTEWEAELNLSDLNEVLEMAWKYRELCK